MKIQISTALIMIAAPAIAQSLTTAKTMAMAEAVPACPGDAEAIPAEFASWTVTRPLTAATDAGSLAAAVVTPGNAVDLALATGSAVKFRVPPSHPGDAGSYGGTASLSITSAGTYRVGAGSAVWIDIVKDNSVLAPSGHGHGPKCSGIRKIVDFALQPGSYVLQITGSHEPRLHLLVAKPR